MKSKNLSQGIIDGLVEGQQIEGVRLADIVSGRFYTTGELRAILPKTLANVVISRCRLIDGVVLGQAVINILAREQVDAGVTTTSEVNDPDSITLAEAADYLRVSERTVRRLVRTGVISAQNLARPGAKKALLRFTKAGLERDVRKAEPSAPAPPPRPKFRFKASS